MGACSTTVASSAMELAAFTQSIAHRHASALSSLKTPFQHFQLPMLCNIRPSQPIPDVIKLTRTSHRMPTLQSPLPPPPPPTTTKTRARRTETTQGILMASICTYHRCHYSPHSRNSKSFFTELIEALESVDAFMPSSCADGSRVAEEHRNISNQTMADSGGFLSSIFRHAGM